MTVAIVSGKGGTGKTTVAVNLATVTEGALQVLDCDVEAPNVRLFFGGTPMTEERITVPVPRVDAALCDGCGECSRFCAFNAIVAFETTALVFPELCHSCGGCVKVCPKNALSEIPRAIGAITIQRTDRVTLIEGRLDIGVAMAPPLIHAVKARARTDLPTIVDAPPGASCSVVAALRGADVALLVTEPTPFGLHDMRVVVDVVQTFNLPCGVVINRAGNGDERVQAFCREQKLPILMELPDDRRIATACSRGELLLDVLPAYRSDFARVWEWVCAHETNAPGR
jgi:MinD superfamily P-loop ATPase